MVMRRSRGSHRKGGSTKRAPFGRSPDVVARALLKALTVCTPRTRYPVGADASALTCPPVSVGVFMELGITGSVPALDAQAVAHQLQEGFWRGAHTGEEQMGGLKWPPITGAGGRHLHDPAGADPGLGDVLYGLFGPLHPGAVAAMADLVVHCHERDLAQSLELTTHFTAKLFQIGLDSQQEVGSLLLELPKNGFWVCRVSA